MAFSPNEMKAALGLGGARNSQFDMVITNPIDGSADSKLTFLGKAASLPAATRGVIEVPYFGRKIKQAGDTTFAEWTVTVINDEDFTVRNAMEEWIQAINDHTSNLRSRGATAAPSSYKTQGQVRQYGKEGSIVKTYEFEGLWPSEISEIETNWETTDSIEEFTITFQYDQWTSQGRDSQNPAPRGITV